jgi:8-oxo-dGTP pyrophosphatase MutT (NUDIX family)
MAKFDPPNAALTLEEIQQHLAGSPVPALVELGLVADPHALRCAAVLIPLVRENGGWSVLLTARTDLVEDHKGQVAFPGGACEVEDGSPEGTALREAQEEIGLPLEGAKILGRLGDYQTISNYLVTPVVAAVDWPFTLQLESREVRRAFTIPLEFLARPGNHTERMTDIRGQTVPLVYFEAWEGEVLWGVSARMMLDLLVRLGLIDEPE